MIVIALLALIAIALILGPHVALWCAIIVGIAACGVYMIGYWGDKRAAEQRNLERQRQQTEQRHREWLQIHTEEWEQEQRATLTPAQSPISLRS